MKTLEEQIREIVNYSFWNKPENIEQGEKDEKQMIDDILSLIKSIVPEKKEIKEFYGKESDLDKIFAFETGFNKCREQIINKIEGNI